MMHILFVYKDPRVSELIDRLRKLSLVPIATAGEFDLGVQYVFEMRPALIFMQEEINGASCLAVASHIKTLLRDSAPQMFLLRDTPKRKPLVTQKSFAGSIDLTDSGDDLLAAVRQLLSTVPGMVWRQKEEPLLAIGEVSNLLQDFDADELDRVAAALRASAESPRLQRPVEPPEHDAVASTTDDRQLLPQSRVSTESVETTAVVAAAPIIAAAAGESFQPLAAVAPLPAELSRNLTIPMPDFAASSDQPVVEAAPVLDNLLADEFKHYEDVMQRRRQQRLRLGLFLGGALAVLLIGGSFYLGGLAKAQRVVNSPVTTALPKAPGESASPVKKAVPDPAVISPTPLPATLATATVDGVYGKKKPGWERRVAPLFELLLYRENGQLRAVQLMAKGANGLSDQLIQEFMQLAGGTAIDWRQSKMKGGLRVEQGVLPNHAEVLRYSRPGTKALVALVVALP